MAEMVIELPYKFAPWPHQEAIFRAFYAEGKRRFCEVWHRRSGKDKVFLNLLIDQMSQRVGNYCHVFPQRNRARRIIWQGIDADGMRYTDHFPAPLIYRKSEVEMTISLCDPQDLAKEGSIYWCLGSDQDAHLLVGCNPVGVIWSEFAEINPLMRELVLPILRRNGGWEAIIMTPRGRNHAYRIYTQVRADQDWHCSYLPITETVDQAGSPLVSPADVAADIRAGMRPETAQQEYYLSWEIPMPGAVYSHEMQALDQEGRVTPLEPLPGLPVSTAWDLGYHDATAIWWYQEVRGDDGRPWYHLLEYHEAAGHSLQWWVRYVRSKPYRYDHAALGLTHDAYEEHLGPHDLENTELGYGKTRATIAAEAQAGEAGAPIPGLHFRTIPRAALEDGIAVVRRFLARCKVDPQRCERGLEALRSYRYELNESNQIYSKVPVHDWASHGADALRTLAMGVAALPAATAPVPEGGTFLWARENARRARHGLPPRTFRR